MAELTHVAIIMDGNGRWAKQRKLPRIAGHTAGLKVARKIAEHCGNKGIKILSLFAFSQDNWRRPKKEVQFLMRLFAQSLENEIEDLDGNNVRLRVIGDRDHLSPKLRNLILDAELCTQSNDGLILVLAINYSGRFDITQAMQQIARKIENGQLNSNDISQELIRKHLLTLELPPPELFIRTSGEKRISDYYLWQSAYSEFYFTDVFWPDFNEKKFDRAIEFYLNRERRFGKISEQL